MKLQWQTGRLGNKYLEMTKKELDNTEIFVEMGEMYSEMRENILANFKNKDNFRVREENTKVIYNFSKENLKGNWDLTATQLLNGGLGCVVEPYTTAGTYSKNEDLAQTTMGKEIGYMDDRTYWKGDFNNHYTIIINYKNYWTEEELQEMVREEEEWA